MLNKEDANVLVYSVHPGIVNTELFNNTSLQKYNQWFMNRFFKVKIRFPRRRQSENNRLISDHILQTPNQGATPIVYAAISDDVERKGGIYISNCMQTGVSKEAENPDICKRLFNLSLEQTGLKNFM